MHFRRSFRFSTYGLYFLPGSNFAPFEEVKVPVSNSVDFPPPPKKSAPWRILEDLGVVRDNLDKPSFLINFGLIIN